MENEGWPQSGSTCFLTRCDRQRQANEKVRPGQVRYSRRYKCAVGSVVLMNDLDTYRHIEPPSGGAGGWEKKA